MIKTISISILLTLLVVLGIFVYSQDETSVGSNVWNATYFNNAATSTVNTVAGDEQIIATSTSRVYVNICNTSANTVYLGLNADLPMNSTDLGIPLIQNACFTINDQNLYKGAIRATSTISSDLTVYEASL